MASYYELKLNTCHDDMVTMVHRPYPSGVIPALNNMGYLSDYDKLLPIWHGVRSVKVMSCLVVWSYSGYIGYFKVFIVILISP